MQHAMDTEDELEGSVRPAEEGGTELETEAEEGELEEGDTELEEGELAGAAVLEAEEGELEGPVQLAMDTEDELEGSVQRSQRLARLRKRGQREWPPTLLPPPTRPPPPTHPPPAPCRRALLQRHVFARELHCPAPSSSPSSASASSSVPPSSMTVDVARSRRPSA